MKILQVIAPTIKKVLNSIEDGDETSDKAQQFTLSCKAYKCNQSLILSLQSLVQQQQFPNESLFCEVWGDSDADDFISMGEVAHRDL